MVINWIDKFFFPMVSKMCFKNIMFYWNCFTILKNSNTIFMAIFITAKEACSFSLSLYPIANKWSVFKHFVFQEFWLLLKQMEIIYLFLLCCEMILIAAGKKAKTTQIYYLNNKKSSETQWFMFVNVCGCSLERLQGK